MWGGGRGVQRREGGEERRERGPRGKGKEVEEEGRGERKEGGNWLILPYRGCVADD